MPLWIWRAEKAFWQNFMQDSWGLPQVWVWFGRLKFLAFAFAELDAKAWSLFLIDNCNYTLKKKTLFSSFSKWLRGCTAGFAVKCSPAVLKMWLVSASCCGPAVRQLQGDVFMLPWQTRSSRKPFASVGFQVFRAVGRGCSIRHQAQTV